MDVEILPNFKMHKNGNGGGKAQKAADGEGVFKNKSCLMPFLCSCSLLDCS